MKPFIKHLNKANGGSTEAQKYSWGFQRKTIAEAKRKAVRNRRRTDKLNLDTE